MHILNEKVRVLLFTSGYLGSSGVLFPFFKLEIGELIFLRFLRFRRHFWPFLTAIQSTTFSVLYRGTENPKCPPSLVTWLPVSLGKSLEACKHAGEVEFAVYTGVKRQTKKVLYRKLLPKAGTNNGFQKGLWCWKCPAYATARAQGEKKRQSRRFEFSPYFDAINLLPSVEVFEKFDGLGKRERWKCHSIPTPGKANNN